MYQWPDRPGRARDGDATAGAHNRPRAGRPRSPRRREARRSRQGMVWHRPCHQRRRQPHRGGRVATSAPRDPEEVRTSGRAGRSNGNRPNAAARASAHEQPTPPETCSPKSPSGTGSATATTRSRSSTSTCGDTGRYRSWGDPQAYGARSRAPSAAHPAEPASLYTARYACRLVPSIAAVMHAATDAGSDTYTEWLAATSATVDPARPAMNRGGGRRLHRDGSPG